MLFSSHSPFLLAQPLAAMNQLSISIDLPIVEISYKWNYTIVSSHLTGFFIGITFAKIIHIVLHFYCCSINCASFLFVAILWRMLFIHSLVDRHLGCFYFLAFMMMPYECLCLHFSVDMCLNSLRYTSEGRIARPCGNSVQHYKNKTTKQNKKNSCQPVFQSICSILHSHKPCMGVPVSSLFSNTCPFSLLQSLSWYETVSHFWFLYLKHPPFPCLSSHIKNL